MPTFTAIALDRLLDPGAAADKSRHPPRPPPPKPKPIPKSNLERRHTTSIVERKTLRPKIKPGLYTTPESTPLPDSPTSFPPSPYIINHKRRGPRLLRSLSGIGACEKALDEQKAGGNGNIIENGVSEISGDSVVTLTVSDPSENESDNGFRDVEVLSPKSVCGSMDEKNVGRNLKHASSDIVKISAGSPQRGSDSEDFFEPQDSLSRASNLDGVDNREDLSASTQAGEFYDAWDELSSDGGTQSSIRDIEAELREMRLSLLIEIESRKQAEEALNSMRKYWEKIREQLFLVGLTLPADLVSSCEDNEQLDPDPIEELCQQITLARYVSESIGRGIAKAEAEVVMEAQIESKNFEIVRLTDRLNYYEAMNSEMSQRNQEAIEMARRNRQERKRKQKWIWGSIAAAITIGTGALLWSYVPLGKGLPSTNHPHALEETDSSN